MATLQLSSKLEFLGICAYLFDGDRVAFRTYLQRSALIDGTVVDDSLRESPLSKTRLRPSPRTFTSPYNGFACLHALAAGDIELAKTIALNIESGRSAKQSAHRITRGFAYLLSAVVTSADRETVESRYDAFLKITPPISWRSLGDVLLATASSDQAAFDVAFAAMIKAHGRWSSSRGALVDGAHTLLFLWGLGLANLACSRSIVVRSSAAVLPQDLIVDMRTD